MAKHPKRSKPPLAPGLPARITKLVEGESDRGAILILAAYLDELLADLVRSICISDEAADDLLEYRRPAGDFESRITLCNALGLIHTAEAAGLQALRKIRNSAAHFDKKGRGFDVLFDSDSTVDQVANMAKAVNLSLSSREPEIVKQTFVISARFLAIRIMFRATDAVRPTVPPTLKEIANAIRDHVKGTPHGDAMKEMEDAIHRGDYERVSAYWKALGAELQSRMKEQGDKNGD
jgi:hypothetical protein